MDGKERKKKEETQKTTSMERERAGWRRQMEKNRAERKRRGEGSKEREEGEVS